VGRAGRGRGRRRRVRLRLIVVGRGARDLAAWERRFLDRLRPFAPCEIVELPEGRGKRPEQRMRDEARHILSRTRAYVLFDERGQEMSSQAWASFFGRQRGDAVVDFVIGGAGGVDACVRQEARAVWRLSALTLPHQLVRALALEQCYRALMILRGHPYHHA